MLRPSSVALQFLIHSYARGAYCTVVCSANCFSSSLSSSKFRDPEKTETGVSMFRPNNECTDTNKQLHLLQFLALVRRRRLIADQADLVPGSHAVRLRYPAKSRTKEHPCASDKAA